MVLGLSTKEDSSFHIEITKESVLIKSEVLTFFLFNYYVSNLKFGQTNLTLTGKGVQFQTEVPFMLVLRAGLAGYILLMDGKQIGQIPYYGILPSPNHIDTVESMESNFIFTQPLQIEWNQVLV